MNVPLHFILVLGVLAGFLSPRSVADDKVIGEVHVVAVGVEDYGNTPDFGPLNYAVDDAEDIAAVLQERYGYSVTTLTNADATRDAIFQKIDVLSKVVGGDDAVIFYFAGHGTDRRHDTPTGLYEGFLIPYITKDAMRPWLDQTLPDALTAAHPFTPPPPKGEAEPDSEEHKAQIAEAEATWRLGLLNKLATELTYHNAVPMLELRERLRKIRSRHVVVILDACFSGLINARSGNLVLESPDEQSKLIARFFAAQKGSRALLTAGTGDQKALEHNATSRGGYSHINNTAALPQQGITNGVFTYELLDALRTVDQEGISVMELHQRVSDRVLYVSLNYQGFGDQSEMMTPQWRDFANDQTHNGHFVFIPQPDAAWGELVVQSMQQLADKREGGALQIRGGEGLTFSPEGERFVRSMDKEYSAETDKIAAQTKLRSKALVTLAVQAGLRQQDSQADLSRDAIWVARFQEASERANVGDGDAMAALYYMYTFGLGTDPNGRLATRWASEAAATESADARAAFIAAIQSSKAELSPEEQQRITQESNRLTPEGQTQLAAAAAVLAISQASGDNNARRAGGMFAGVLAVGAVMNQRLGGAPVESIEASIAQLWKDIDTLGMNIRDAGRTGTINSPAYDELAARITSVSTRIRRNAKRELAFGHDQTIVELTTRSSSETLEALKTIGSGVYRISTRRGQNEALDGFDRLERSYASLVALFPYIQNQVSWDEG